MPARRIGRTRCPTVAPLRLVSKGRSISRLWKKRTFSIATPKLSSISGDSAARAAAISPDAVEALGVLQERLVAPLAHVRDDAPGGVADPFREEPPGPAELRDDLLRLGAAGVEEANQRGGPPCVWRPRGRRPRRCAGGTRRGWR